MSFYKCSSAASSTNSLESTSSTTSTPESVIALYPASDFNVVPVGAALPLPGPRRVRSGSFSEARGNKFNYTIQIEPAKPTGEVAVAKGHLEPRAGSLPRRTRKKVQPQAPVVVEVKENKSFDFVNVQEE